PIAINSATYIGYKLLGVFGSVCATLGVVLPSFIIIYIISLFFNDLLGYEVIASAFNGIKAVVSALILLAGIKMFKSTQKNLLTYLTFGVTLVLCLLINIFNWNVSSVFLIIAGAVVGLISVFALQSKEKKQQQNISQELPLSSDSPLDGEGK
ncbi:MAG: chromate transporter, partial [Clostridia bacterium]|nr:chromate transporter [Clostridia bacterium]